MTKIKFLLLASATAALFAACAASKVEDGANYNAAGADTHVASPAAGE